MFKEKPNEEFVCAICFGVFNNPVADDCGHIYCAECLFDWFKVKDTCPISCSKIRKETIRKPPLPFTNLLGALEIKCPKCGDKYIQLDQYDDGCPDCLTSRFSSRPRASNAQRQSQFGQSSNTRFGQSSNTRFANSGNLWEGVKWAGVATAVGAGLLVLISSMKNKNRD
ncbi:RING finger protein 151-like [Panonychus citri]|nr:RING finger protein 151-like [Panonychus citri]